MIMELTFAPVRSDDALALERRGTVLVVNGQMLDFAGLAEGDRLEAEAFDCAFLVSEVSRDEDALRATLLLPYGPDAPEESRFPPPVTVSEDGPVRLPGRSGTQAGA